MTEEEWQAANNPRPMFRSLEGKVSERKLRLFCVLCCRRIWHLLTDERSRDAVVVAERLSDGLADENERASAESQAGQAAHEAVLARQGSDDLPEMFVLAARAASYACFGERGLDSASAVV